MARYLVDTDVFIDHLRAGLRVPTQPEDSAYSSITRAELYAGTGTDEAIVDMLLSPFEEIPVEQAIAEEGGRIRRGNPSVSLPDALVAATALTTGRILVTRNERHFRGMRGLRLRVPKQRR